MVQRMIGSQQLGTGGSSGYQYLKSTLRYLSASININIWLIINGENWYQMIYSLKRYINGNMKISRIFITNIIILMSKIIK